MSSLMQFDGEISRKGVRLEFCPVKENPRFPDSSTLGIETETYVCLFCGREHSIIYIQPGESRSECLGVGFNSGSIGKSLFPIFRILSPFSRFPAPRNA